MEKLKGNLIVSCQALPDEPLHSSYIMGRMALAAKMGGAKGIRANTKEDIQEIKKVVDLPVIGIVKREYPDSEVFITPTMKEVEELIEAQANIIALDATNRIRPHGVALKTFFQQIKHAYPKQRLMADCATIEEAILADQLGFDFIGTTLLGYTKQSEHHRVEDHDFEIIKEIVKHVKHPVIAEGNIDTPQKARRVLQLGCYSVVVGSIITRPQLITKRFYEEIQKEGENIL